MPEDEKDRKGFVVTDKRSPADAEPGPEAAAEAPRREPADRPDARLPKIDFATFIFSLNSAVLAHLGIVEDPAGGGISRNLPLAKQTIDLLGMLQEKTRGNLDADEERMLNDILYDLRIRYVRETA